MLARRDAAGVRLLTRRGIDWTARYPSIAAAVAALSCRSCRVDGEVVICGEDGIPVFDRLRYGRQTNGAEGCQAGVDPETRLSEPVIRLRTSMISNAPEVVERVEVDPAKIAALPAGHGPK
jgi:hypothetical protein